jgi:hypothetical protein
LPPYAAKYSYGECWMRSADGGIALDTCFMISLSAYNLDTYIVLLRERSQTQPISRELRDFGLKLSNATR